jgi:hypothetical protein
MFYIVDLLLNGANTKMYSKNSRVFPFTSLPCALKLLTFHIQQGYVVRIKQSEEIEDVLPDAINNDTIIGNTENISVFDLEDLIYIT